MNKSTEMLLVILLLHWLIHITFTVLNSLLTGHHIRNGRSVCTQVQAKNSASDTCQWHVTRAVVSCSATSATTTHVLSLSRTTLSAAASDLWTSPLQRWSTFSSRTHACWPSPTTSWHTTRAAASESTPQRRITRLRCMPISPTTSSSITRMANRFSSKVVVLFCAEKS